MEPEILKRQKGFVKQMGMEWKAKGVMNGEGEDSCDEVICKMKCTRRMNRIWLTEYAVTIVNQCIF